MLEEFTIGYTRQLAATGSLLSFAGRAGANNYSVTGLASNQAAWALAGRLGLTVADSRTELDWAAAEARAVVWAPARMARDVPDLAPEPMALALWLAQRLGATRLNWALRDGEAPPAPPAGFSIPTGRL